MLLERHDLAIRYRLSRETPLAEVFRTLEEAKVSLGLEEYGVCQVRSARRPARRLLSCMLSRGCWLRRPRWSKSSTPLRPNRTRRRARCAEP